MLGEEFKTWPADSIPITKLLTIGIHVTNFGNLEDGLPYFTELPDSGIKESDRMLIRLNTAAVILDNND